MHSNAFILLLHSEPLCIKFYVASDPQRKVELYYDKCMSSEMVYTVLMVVKLRVNDVFISRSGPFHCCGVICQAVMQTISLFPLFTGRLLTSDL